jgi:hypothetical protein
VTSPQPRRYPHAAAALVLLLAGCGGSAATPSTDTGGHTLTGELVLTQTERTSRPIRGGEVTSCSGTGGYDDVRDGLQVVVRDGEGTIIGRGELVTDRAASTASPNGCTFDFTVDSLPEVDFYNVEIGDRGELTYSFADLEEAGWRVESELGP